LKPVAAEVEETSVGPVAGGQEEDEEEERAVEARPVEEIGAQKEEEYEGRRCICRDKEERKPTARA
jgi:hypothetical protein